MNDYVFDLKCITNELDFSYNMQNLYGDCFDVSKSNEKIDSLKKKATQDSITYAKVEAQLEKLKNDKDIRALGYTFTLHTIVKMAGQEFEKDHQKVIFIMNDGNVYSCVNK